MCSGTSPVCQKKLIIRAKHMLRIPTTGAGNASLKLVAHAVSHLPGCASPLLTLLPDNALEELSHLLKAVQVLLSVVKHLCQEGCSVLGRCLPLQNQVGGDLHPCKPTTSSGRPDMLEEAFLIWTMSSSLCQAHLCSEKPCSTEQAAHQWKVPLRKGTVLRWPVRHRGACKAYSAIQGGSHVRSIDKQEARLKQACSRVRCGVQFL